MGRIVGIDLGTTNSLIAVWTGTESRAIPVAGDDVILPSAVALDPAEGLVVGRRARELSAEQPDRAILSAKRFLGTEHTFVLGTELLRPQEVSAFVLKELKRRAEAHLEAPVDRAVISVPAYFTDPQRRATREAGELAGLKVERLLSEPTAAALAYGIDRLQAEEFVVVYDLGGGTFDVSVLEMFEGLFSVRATDGESRLGGDDIDERLMEWILQRSRRQPKLSDLASGGRAALRHVAERAKIELSAAMKTRIVLEPVPLIDRKSIAIDVVVTRADLEKLTADLLERSGACLRRVLTEARVPRERVAEVILVGGPTLMPAVRSYLARLFGKEPRATVDPMKAVALGAAIQARLLDPVREDAIPSEILVSDICPFTLGVAAVAEVGGRFRPGAFIPIIERNTALPAQRSERFFTLNSEQESVVIEVYQGDDPLAENNVFLDRYFLGGFPRGRDEPQPIDITFRYDEDGILRVDAVVVSTGKSAGIRIDHEKMKAVGLGLTTARTRVDTLWEKSRRHAALHEVLRAVEARLGEVPPDVQAVLARKITAARRALEREDIEAMETLGRELRQWAGPGDADGA